MVIVDTSVWIDFFKGHEPCFSPLSVLLADRQVLALPCVFGELLQGARNKKEQVIITDFWQSLPKVSPNLFETAWIQAGSLSSKERWFARGIGLIDSTILYIAKESSNKLWTLDKEVMKVAKKLQIDFTI
jgi:predicted nucleic acid-binding protein